MNFRAIVLLAVLALLALFGAQNWTQITTVPEPGAGARFLDSRFARREGLTKISGPGFIRHRVLGQSTRIAFLVTKR